MSLTLGRKTMKSKWRILTILLLAGLHTLVTYALVMVTFPVVMDHFDSGEPFSWDEKLPIHVSHVLLAPYYLIIYTAAGLLPYSPIIYGAVWVGNSLLWGFALEGIIRFTRRRVKGGPSPNP
jgi:amino acid transporter